MLTCRINYVNYELCENQPSINHWNILACLLLHLDRVEMLLQQFGNSCTCCSTAWYTYGTNGDSDIPNRNELWVRKYQSYLQYQRSWHIQEIYTVKNAKIETHTKHILFQSRNFCFVTSLKSFEKSSWLAGIVTYSHSCELQLFRDTQIALISVIYQSVAT